MKEKVFKVRLLKQKVSIFYVMRIVVLLGISIFLMFLAASFQQEAARMACWAGAVLLILILIFNKESRYPSFDDKIISISKKGVAIDSDGYTWPAFTKMGIFTNGYYGFRYKIKRPFGTSVIGHHGYYSQIYFRIENEKFNYRFVIPNRELFILLNEIMEEWQQDGRSFVWKAAVSRAMLERNREWNQ